MPDAKKDTKHEALLTALRSLEAQKMAQMAALNASPAPAAASYAPLVQAVRSQPNRPFVPHSAKEAEEYGRQWQQQHAQQAAEDYGYLPEGGQKPAYLEELKRRGVIQASPDVTPAAAPAVPYKLAPEMLITGRPQTDINLDEIRGRGNPIQYLPTAEYPGQTGLYMDRASDTVVEPAPKNPEEKRQIIEDELQQRKWDNRLLPEFQTPDRRLVYKL